MENYSPVVDLRSSRAVSDDGSIFNNNPVNITQDTVIGSSSNRWNVARNMQQTKASKNITIANNATLSIYAFNNADYGYVFASTVEGMDLTWSGGNIVIDFQTGGWGGIDSLRGGIMANDSLFQINSNLDFTYRENANSAGHDYTAQGVAAVAANYDGTTKLLGNRIKINAIGRENQNIGLGIFSLVAHDGGSIYLNAKDDGSANNQNAIVQLDGSISTGLAKNDTHYAGNGKIYANFTGGNSYLNGNIYSGRYSEGSKLVANFTDGASMTGEIVLLGDSSTTSQITLSNGSALTGDINALSDGKHNITFDSSSFVGTIERNENDIAGTTIGGSTGNDIGTTLGTRGSGANTSVSFINTGGKVFGDGTNDIVASSYTGSIYGVFDVSANSSTIIKGSSDGSKGFIGQGANTLVFDFKGNAKSNVANNKSFTVAGGNANSLYAFSGFNALDFTALDGTVGKSVYAKLKDAGIDVAVDQQGATTNNHIQGTLFFQKTNMTIGSNGLFSTGEVEKIVGTGNDLNGLALGAMFGNATWNDANRDGVITANEIISNSGVNYKLDNGKTPLEANEDANTSLGDIGSLAADGSSDGIKKHIAFVFTDDTYLFGGGDENDKGDARYNKQGYSGTIRGGTTDSKYYFVNAGYVDRTQVDEAQGDLVLFNTALHGDLGVKNQTVNIMLDFSDGKRGLKAIGGTDDANIVGAGNKDVVFNLTDNTQVVKYSGSVVGNAGITSGDSANGGNDKDNGVAKYTMLNLAKYKYKVGDSRETVLDGDGSLKVSSGRGTPKTLINAIQEAGLSNFNKTDNLPTGSTNYPNDTGHTDISLLSTTDTTLALRGTSLDATNMAFTEYVYDFAFGSGFGDLNGVAIQDSKLKGVIDLTSSSADNKDLKHSFVFKGTAINGEAGVLATNGKLSGFSYDDSTAKYQAPVTFKLSGLYVTISKGSVTASSYVSNTASDKVKGDSLVFTQTNLEGDLWADSSVAINLDFRDGRTWKMDSSGLFLKNGGNLIVHKEVAKNKGANTPTLQIAMTSSSTQQKIELINTGMQVKLLHKNGWGENDKLANTFTLRGTSLNTYWSNDLSGNADGLHGYADSGLNLVFAKGANLDTTATKTAGGTYKIIDKELDSDQTYGGTYSENGYVGNYIAESTLTTTKLVTRSVNAVFVGEGSYDESGWGSDGKITQNSAFTFANAGTDSNRLDGSKLANLLSTNNATTTVTLEGTSLDNSTGGIVSADKDETTFNMTFVKGTSGTYISDLTNQYTDLARTTNAGGALKDSILKIAQSTLDGGINFQNSNFNVLFVGNSSQNLSGSNVFQGGTASSTVTFRDSNLNAGNGTSSISGIKGTVAFDLTHASEDMEISGTLGNMLGDGGKHQVQFKNANNQTVSIDRLIFVSLNDIASSTSLSALGQYFNDIDTFGSLAQEDYSDLTKLTTVDKTKSSSLTFASGGVVALTSGEVVFVGKNSHQFDASDNTANKLGNSTGGTLTFIDAGNLKLDNIVNISGTTPAQTGKGTINLIGTTNFDLGGTNHLTLFKAKNGQQAQDVTGAGITINAIFTGSNALGASANGIETTFRASQTTTPTAGHKASTANIGQAGEQTIYHILFDYTSSNLTFGQHHAYTGNITGLTSDSMIKFKNAGYINDTQINGTDATILVDNTQIRGDFRGDIATLDFRNDKKSISGGILSSDTATAMVDGVSTIVTAENLSRKKLVFDLTGTTKANFTKAIQVGNKTGTDYGTTETSKLTFINAPAMTVGKDTARARAGAITNSSASAVALSIAKDIGFNAFATATTTAPTLSAGQNIGNTTSYILAGTELEFKGTNITADSSDKSITENLYSLNLSFDMSEDRGVTELGSGIGKSTLTANSIVMGNATTPLNLSLNFKNKGSLNAPNGLNVKLKDNAIFNLNAKSSNGNIGTIILADNTTTPSSTSFNLNAQSSMTIAEGSMNFVGIFDTSADQTTQASDYGTVDVSFNGTNKAYGIIKHKGDTKITLIGNALLSDTDAKALGYKKPSTQFADLVIDATATDTTNNKTLTLNLAHTSGLVGIAGASASNYASANLNNVAGSIAVKGNFDLGQANIALADSKLKVYDDTYFKVGNNSSITLADSTSETSKSLTINATGGNVTDWKVDLTLTNLDPNLTVKLTNLSTNGTFDNWNDQGVWNIRGTNIDIEKAFWSSSSVSKTFVFAKGSGTEVVSDSRTSLTLDKIQGADKINASSLSGNITSTSGGGHSKGIAMKGSFTFIGKEALGVDPDKQNIDGMKSDSNDGNVTFNLYNSLLKSGSILLDKTANGNMNNTTITDTATLRGTDTFNLSVSKKTSNGANNSTIDAVYVNGTATAGSDTSVTGVRYIDASSNHAYASTYATSNAGGTLSETQLKTLESKAYGNITLDGGVTATMKFIGENSHSFDGKTAVYQGADNTYGTSDDEFYFSSDASSTTATDWKKIEIQPNGSVQLSNTVNGSSITDKSKVQLATLSGGSSSSRFDFDHTSVRLDLIKDASGKTYIYNSNVIGKLDVDLTSITQPADPIPDSPSTTIFFNEQMTDTTTLPSASANFIQEYANDGISLDLGVAHQLTADNLGATDTNGTPTTNKVLENTDKQTNLVFIGKGSIDAKVNEGNKNNNSGNSIDLSFMPTGTLATGYSFTFVNAGEFTDAQINTTGKNFGDVTGSSSDGSTTIFGSNAVILIDTYVLGERAFSQKGFVDMAQTRNQKSSWTGNDTSDPSNPIIQNLIFDFNQGVYGDNQKIQFNGNNANAIANTSAGSSYIFTNIFKSGTKDQDRVLALTQNGLRTAINAQLKTLLDYNQDAIKDDVKGTLGLRGVSIRGNINESTSTGDKVDIVFNSTSNISFIDRFKDNGEPDKPLIQETGYNKIANIYGINNKKSNISGYAVLMSADSSKAVSISGDAKKTITFIGDKAVNGEVGGFEKLSIAEGTADSTYTFHTVGTLSDGFLQGVNLQKKTGVTTTANLGTFTFIDSTIDGDINVDPNTNDSANTNTDHKARLVFDNVAYSGEISGSLIKNLKFGKGSGKNDIDKVKITGGSEYSVYDFSNLAGETIHLDINMKDSGTSTYLAPTITGFENGNISLVGSINLAKTELEISGNSNQTNSFVFTNSSSWTMTGNSRVMSLTLNNSGSNYNLDLASAPRTESTNNDLRVLEVGNLYANGGQVLLGTVINTQEQSKSQSDKINAGVINQGTLYVTAQDTSLKSGSFATDGNNAIVLVSANSAYGEVKGAQRKQGLSYAITELEHQITVDNTNWIEATQENIATANEHRWVLSGFDNQTNQELVDESAFVISNPYRMLMIETNNLNKRMGELRDNDYNQGSWIRVFNGMDSGEGAKNLYTNIQLGYDYGISAIGAKNYTGVAFSTSIVDIDGDTFNGKSNTYSLAVYDSYIADNGLYVDTIAKYLYTDQKLSLNGTGADSSFGNHAGSLGIEFGYRAYVADSSFYFEPQAELIAGVIAGVKDINLGVVGGLDIMGELQTTFALNSRIGLVQGYTLKTESGFVADFRLGLSALNEYVSNENPIQLYDSIKTIGASMGNDTKLVLNVGTNLILTDQWRVYIDVEKSFLGKRNTDYQANVGARFSFGEKISSKQDLEKPMPLKLKSEEDKEVSEEKKEEEQKIEEKNSQAELNKTPKSKIEDKTNQKESKK